ncbi:MAG: acyl-ACP--UDP-N-acetylglucosamine O-acyltransferase [Paraburkholderia sp.]|uniref:acyl-ACP--UDP-N-acetylglucosamine O-acyltransferase n=1 Tax=Paraburkholderia sp. TaxID=1926495 RepID=UPI00121D9677|nr:acyl-ACP--UDP-N-acetylglucosamine O-acyltransferase [Paraburkholderia sp.]TAM03898.1 MAG: acyl-ACP--UDP-N-acetylglucosamine O-acyltransferase [Paraburkholderia sp.]TAM32456.1 MAG: acyl-ACP--UDP-N-acetylglucosamine O-acyltransferase [Paraburkholderia sp.]
MSRIHPTAIVEPGAQVDESVEIGAYAVVGANVSIGARTIVGSHTVIEGHTTIGEDNRFGHFAAIGGRPQDMKYKGEPTKLVIGNRNTIREYTTVHTGTVQDTGVTIVGDDNWIMAYVHVGHDCRLGSNVIMSSNAQLAGHVIVDDYAIVGGMTGVHQFVRIGAHSMVGGASALVQDVPPFVVAAGNKAVPHGVNVEGLRRRGFSPDAISALRSAYRTLYKNGLSLEEAKVQLAELAEAGGDGDVHVKALIAFVEQSQRGIIR